MEPVAVLGGGMISEVAKRLGLSFSEKGWSLYPLLSPGGRQAITGLHLKYLEAGASLGDTAPYNVSAEAVAALDLAGGGQPTSSPAP
jgi:S-methylmethionine-dependent homocysteine/selenocysteine methylase